MYIVCDIMCWIPTNAPRVHGFNWVKSCFEYCRHCDWWTQMYRQFLWPVTHWFLRCSLNQWKVNPGFVTQKKSPFRRRVPTTEVKDTKIMWTFFRDQILCPLNGGVLWIEVFHCIKLFPSPFCNRFFFLFMTLTPYASNFFLFFVFCRIVICGSTIAYHFPTPQILRLVSHNSRWFSLLIACH